MDILRAEAEEILQKLTLDLTYDRYEAMLIETSRIDPDYAVFDNLTISGADLSDFLNGTAPRPGIISTRIIRLHFLPGGVTPVPYLFPHVWHSFKLDFYMMYMMYHNLPGFFQLRSCSASQPLRNFYVNCHGYWLLWTHDPTTLATNVVMISRMSRGGIAAYPRVHAAVERYKVLAGSPLFPALITILDRVVWVDAVLQQQHENVIRAEKHTGFSHFYINAPRPRSEDTEEELAQLAQLSRLTSSVLVAMADMVQHLRGSVTVVQILLNSSQRESPSLEGCEAVFWRSTQIASIAQMLDLQIHERFGYVAYLKERAHNQMTVIFNLLARGDAQLSVEIAKAARHDSTSMKTIAMMTMGFLPATFFAALFAVPSLQWDQPTVMGDRFWTYWAVTIPTTIFVFVVWIAMMRWAKLWRRFSRRHRTMSNKEAK